ncbi:Mitochondrial dicarboxylate transporter [Yamadazyma tenuis]|uniref:Mitochondrial thiamine pyrophosphate carrier 1 n=1 Tax=Candida tenuis (strain ATCC 10573 / BCRC 21748 / CBS 615 / JCM 9827 / NBRC 10315 / NRRL Y-1498 / VKM Y-70) TaxID=590646 RepID=G3B410_CANTC|nr:mitochondrial carrier [Yamadazyma tenuis ATCC 10573]EGV63909.1 mitochondrial carrier [Yamadazyma tenuis ATCC 10573]WEJ96471.1 Mitochondrial dicarboxylate transporter [Yamadazyma tenuis]
MSASTQKVKYPFWYGGASSMVACLVTHPLDLAKVRLQTASKPGQSLVSMVYQIITKEGFFKIYSGLTASLLRQATYSTVRFGVYEYLKDSYVDTYHRTPDTVVLLPMSMVAGALGGLVGNPSDVVNIRMQNDSTLPVEQRRNYRNAFDGVFRIVKEEKISALFRGLMPNLTRGILMTASQVVTYDIAKNILVKDIGMDANKKSTHFSSSLLAGLVATTACSPADVVKTRIMNAKGGGSNALTILKTAVKNEGIGFMFRGWLPSFIRLGPHTIVTFLALEQLRKFKIGM